MVNNPKLLTQITLITLLIIGCFLIVSPFIAAILFAAVVVVSTWPVYLRIYGRMEGKPGTAGGLMVLLLVLLVLMPMIFLSASVAELLGPVTEWVRVHLKTGLGAPPEWLRDLPLVGEQAAAYWRKLAVSKTEMTKFLDMAYEPVSNFLLKATLITGEAVLQLALVLFISFFFYRDGEKLGALLATVAEKLGGQVGVDLLLLARSTVKGVMEGIVGTAVGQGLVAFVGFLIAGVPAAAVLGFAVFVLSVVPVGPPLIWGGAALWLYNQGEAGWAIFIVIYGLVVISSVDNVLKPILISRSASLPILLIALGVFGGILAFGFIGMFLGPTLLALAYVLVQRWTRREENS